MNCNQARTLLSVYRDLQRENLDTAELDAHVEECAACRETLANDVQIGERLRSTPLLAPSQDMHAKLMRALADEQLKFLQKSTPGTVSTPEFLKPYLQERAEEAQSQDGIAAFSTAQTGPLPVIPVRRKRHQARVNQLAILGLAAAILMLLMTGGLTSLLMLARNNPASISRNSASVAQQTQVEQKVFATNTPYSNVTSAIPEGNSIYYTASGSIANNTSWMLMQFNRNTQVSQPLLDSPGNDPLILLTASDHWLVWLDYSLPQPGTHGSWAGAPSHHSPQRAWNLHYLSLWPQPQTALSTQTPPAATSTQTDLADNAPVVLSLAQGIFDSDTAPTWVTTPVTGSWLMGNTLLVTQIDQQGISHLKSYQLDQVAQNAQEIATAAVGHIFSWPTANSMDTQIYWADEWVSANGVLQSNIWQQQTSELIIRSQGQLKDQIVNTQKLLMADGMSFQPQVVDDTLFLLSTSEVTVSSDGEMIPNGIPLPINAADTSATFIPRTDLDIYKAPADALVHGTLFMIPLDGPARGTESMLGMVGQSTGFQGGSDYVVWQDSTGYKMYDVQRQEDIAVGNTLNNATLLIVNEHTTLWSSDIMDVPGQKVGMMAFTWPN